MRIQRAIARDVAQAPAPDPEALGAAEGRAIAQVGQAFGNLVDLGLEVYDGYNEQLAKNRGLQADDQLRRAAEESLRNPVFEDREKDFLDRAKKIREDLGDGISGARRADYEFIVSRSRNQHAMQLRANTLRDEFESAEILANETARRAALMAATAPDPVAQADAISVGEDAFRGLARFGMSEEAQALAIQKFHRSVLDGQFVAGLRENPAETYRALQTPGRGLAVGRTAVELEQMRTRTLDEIERQLLRDDQVERAQTATELRERKQLAFDANVALTLKARSPEGVTVDDVYEYAHVLGGDKSRELATWVLDSGGRITPKATNIEVYLDLMNRSRSGEDMSEAILEASRLGQIDDGDVKALTNESRSTRFSPAIDYLKDLIPPLGGNPLQRHRSGQAEMMFSRWIAANPNATMEAAEEKALELATRGSLLDATKIKVAQFPPKYAVQDESGADDIVATRKETTRRFRAGEIGRDEYLVELKLIKRIEAAQEAEQARNRAKSQASGGDQ